MLKKLKTKFILTNMLLVGIVLAVVFTAVCIFTYRTQTQEIERALEQALVRRGKKEPHIGDFPFEPIENEDYVLPYVYAFPVLVDLNGNILFIYDDNSDMDEEILREAIRLGVSDEEESGILRDLGLIYLREKTALGYMIAFTSTEHLYTSVKNTVWVSLGAFLGSLLLFLAVSVILAGYAIRPIDKAWQQQKQFVADASHELKTPLTVILANNGILLSQMDAFDESTHKWLESTEEEAERMRNLIDKMLTLAKTEDMGGRLEFSEYSASELCEQVLLQFEAVAFERNILLSSEIEADVHLKTNEESFVRLVHILLDNAIKYSPAGKTVSLSLATSRTSVRLSVCNRGELIPKEDLPHLFERFYRADKARSVGGYGLGLSIAKNLAEGLRAEISASSDEKNGTVFTVQFRK